ncbi:two-component regulator propeller domain-containing protein [Massilia sp. PWRC2]|uniref:hybrid sensor histidine kinase/response regulator n=1 Tax=Massilia sp. PWRC2 TaxID=2804626 RepID=UPI003CE817CD
MKLNLVDLIPALPRAGRRRASVLGVLALLVSLLLAGAFAPAAAAPPRSLRFEQLSVEHGLAQESILAVAQDRDGFMWFGSQTGLSRFDGYRVTTYRNDITDPTSLVNNWVRVLHVDGDGKIWIGTDGGLDRFDPDSGKFSHYAPPRQGNRGNGDRHIHAIADDGKGSLWLATADGLQRFDIASGSFTLWHKDDGDATSVASNSVNALALEAGGRLWVGTNLGLDSLAPGASAFEHHAWPSGDAKTNNVSALLMDATGTLWIGTTMGLETWKVAAGPAGRRRLGAAETITGGHITVLFQDGDTTIWAGSHDDGLYRWMPQLRRFANHRNQPTDNHSLADNFVSSIYRDRVGTFWVGTWYAGVSRVDLGSGGFTRIVRVDGSASISDNKVRAIADGADGKLWLGTNDGLNHYDPASGASTLLRHDPSNPASLAAGPINAVARDRHGLVWVGSRSAISSVDPATGRVVRQQLAGGDPDGELVRALLVGRDDLLWVATRGGLHRFDLNSRQIKTYRHDPHDPASLANNVVRPMLEDRQGRLWVGTFDGLDLFDRASGSFRHFRHNPADRTSISHDEVHHLMQDHRGDLWIGTAVGLNKMITAADGSISFRRYTTVDGLADDAVAAMLEDEQGNLWISSSTGLSRFSPLTNRWRTYSSGDGTIEGAYFDSAAYKGADGTLYFGGFNGITAFNPRAISDNLMAPRAVITGFQVFNKPVAQVHPGLLNGPIEHASEIVLAAADSVFSLEFSALHYAAPQRNRFAYQLVGFDKGWVNTDASKRFATYTNLDPGSYTFRVKAANKDGVWSPQGASLKIVILPPLWKTWWMRSIAALLALGLAYAAYRFRMRALRRQKALLEAQVRARTAEIGQQNRLLERQKLELETRRREAEDQRADAEQRHLDAERQKAELQQQKENVELAHRNISILSEIGREMTATLDMETIMATVYRHVHHLMDARSFGIGIYHPEREEIDFPFAIDEGVRIPRYQRSTRLPDQLAVWCLTHRREVFINDRTLEFPRYFGAPETEHLTELGRIDGSPITATLSTMYVPMLVKDRVMGVLCVQSVERNAYRRVHLDMLQTLAAHAAVALDNARAYRQLEQMEQQVRLNTEELALANRALQENDERLRLAKQRAEDATRQKSEFLANMSHEMRTPLAGVIGMLGFALRDARLQASTREQIVRGQANAQVLLAIINDLLDFSKIEAGKLAVESIDFALSATLETVGALFEEQAAAHSVSFDIMVAPDLPRYVVGDPARLRQVLVNLVGNAFKFTERGGVSVRVGHVRGAPPRAGVHMIEFSVADTGIGISREAQSRLFQKFEQADSTTTRRYGGTGLGLAICRQLVELMGGAIRVDSEPGKGSCFSFVLPLADGVAPVETPVVPLTRHRHSLRVLCAEDFPTNQIIIRMMLQDLGHQVDIADNGQLALAACAARRYDVILMDGRMPELDGESATRAIRAGGPPEAPVLDRELMIIALTANASEEDRARYLAAGMDDFLTKPIDEAALHQHMTRAIERQLARGIALMPMAAAAPVAATAIGLADLDAMFGVSTMATPPAVASALADGGGRSAALKARMLAAFAADLPARRAELAAAIATRDHDSAARVLHGIKGSAAYLADEALQLLAGELEVAADQQQWQQIEAGMPRLGTLLERFDTSRAA